MAKGQRSVLFIGIIGVLIMLMGSGPQYANSSGQVLIVPKGLVQLNPRYGGALIVDKSRAALDLYGFEGSQLKKIRSFPIASGKMHGNKITQGDLRTPEGIYYLTEFKAESTLAPKYGVGAFVLDYPNFFDRLFQKTGGGIWLHGTNQQYRVSEKFDSEGCVVLENADLRAVTPFITLNKTPILIYNEVPLVEIDELGLRRQILSQWIENWRVAWESKNLDKYIEFYSRDYFNARGMKWTGWRAYKQSIFSQSDPIEVSFKDLRIVQYHPYVYVDFVQHYKSRAIDEEGEKRIVLFDEKGQMKIVSETFFKRGETQGRNVSGKQASSVEETL